MNDESLRYEKLLIIHKSILYLERTYNHLIILGH